MVERTRVHEVVHTLRQKPHHVRENIALGVAGGITLVVALGWFVANSAAGTFSLAPQTLASDAARAAQPVAANPFQNVAGAAGAALGASTTPAGVTVVDATPPAAPAPAEQNLNNTSQTVIHF